MICAHNDHPTSDYSFEKSCCVAEGDSQLKKSLARLLV